MYAVFYETLILPPCVCTSCCLTLTPDVDECVLPGVCNGGRCVNLEGTHECVCGHGYQPTPDSKACEGL